MSDNQSKKTAGALDIRNIIGALLGIYGVVLVLAGLLGDQAGQESDDLNANLWAGLALLLGAAVFITWARLRPIVVPKDIDKDLKRPDVGH